jgi:hypothetical protein
VHQSDNALRRGPYHTPHRSQKPENHPSPPATGFRLHWEATAKPAGTGAFAIAFGSRRARRRPGNRGVREWPIAKAGALWNTRRTRPRLEDARHPLQRRRPRELPDVAELAAPDLPQDPEWRRRFRHLAQARLPAPLRLGGVARLPGASRDAGRRGGRPRRLSPQREHQRCSRDGRGVPRSRSQPSGGSHPTLQPDDAHPCHGAPAGALRPGHRPASDRHAPGARPAAAPRHPSPSGIAHPRRLGRLRARGARRPGSAGLRSGSHDPGRPAGRNLRRAAGLRRGPRPPGSVPGAGDPGARGPPSDRAAARAGRGDLRAGGGGGRRRPAPRRAVRTRRDGRKAAVASGHRRVDGAVHRVAPSVPHRAP